MQQTATPRPTAAPQPPAVPGSRSELNQLTMQRNELQAQLRELTARRSELAQQRAAMSREAGQGHDLRIAAFDAQSARLEAQLVGVNEAIVAGVAKGVAQVAVPDAGPITAEVVRGLTQGLGQAGTIDPATMRLIRGQVSNAAEDAVFGAFAVSTVTLLGVLVLWRGFRRFIWKRKPALGDQSVRLTQLQQSVDVIAIEVERISEAQRYLTKVMHERVPQEVPANRT